MQYGMGMSGMAKELHIKPNRIDWERRAKLSSETRAGVRPGHLRGVLDDQN
jgi:hypothetical protein